MRPQWVLLARLGWAAASLGVLVWPVAAAGQRVTGRVHDQTSGAPVAGVQVVLLDSAGRAVATGWTQADGRFSVGPAQPGTYRVRFQVPGYRMLVTSPLVLGPGAELGYSLTLTPVPPEQLDTLLVEGRPVSRLLAGFYRRRANAFGNFLTHDEFMQWGPVETTDIVRRLPWLTVLPNRGDSRGYRLVGARERRLQQPCPPAIFRDGLFIGTADEVDVDLVFVVDGIEAVEAYGGDAGLPAEFVGWGRPGCGVLAFWTRTAIAPAADLRLDLSGQVGGRIAGSRGAGAGRLGMAAAFPVAGAIEVVPGANLVLPLVGSAPQPTGFQALLAVRVHPFGLRSPWYLGVGATALYLSERRLGVPLEVSTERDEGHYFLLTGAWLPVRGPTRPFAELQWFDPLAFGSAEWHGFVGLAHRVGR